MEADGAHGRACVEFMREDRIDLVQLVRKREQAYVAEKSRILRSLRAATVIEVANAVAVVRATHGRKTKLGCWEHRSAKSCPRDLSWKADVPVESWLFYQMKRPASLNRS
eukprot:IDg11337t1